mmetsp:Transcript_100837/g.314345  ORF Transcript_100837/g.314345 Transcript_100837/m.314345 type:complete len:298 (-) Transcript_100837:179-1072(-)
MPWLAKYKVSDLALPSPLVTLSHPKSGLFEAIDLLAEKNLLSVPVLDAGDGALLGVLDCLDVVAHVVRTATEGTTLVDVPLDKVMGLARDGAKPAEVGLEVLLDEVAEVISGPARRAVVMGADGKAYSVITQSTFLQFLHSKMREVEAMTERLTAEDLCTRSPICVAEGQSALNAFRAINENGVSSVAIVDEESGHVVSVASATDLVVGLARAPAKAKALQKLEEDSILDLVSDNRRLDYKGRAATVSVRPDAGLEHVLEKLAKTRVHRVMVCAEGRKPHGVLSLTDVCRVMAQQKA